MKANFIKAVKKNVFMIHELHKAYLPLLFIREMLSTIIPFIEIFLSAKILDLLIQKEKITIIMQSVLWMVGTVFVLRIIIDIIRYILYIKGGIIYDSKNNELSQKAIKMDYDILERKSTLDIMAKAEDASDAMGGFPGYCSTLFSMLGSIVSLIATLITILGLTSTVPIAGKGGLYSFMSSPYSSILLVIMVAFSVYFNSKCESKTGKLNYEANMQNTEHTRIYWFFFNLMFNQSMGKDIRLFHMHPLIMSEERRAQESIENVKKTTLKKTVKIEAISSSVHIIFLLFAYLFVGIKAVLGIITVGELTMYVGIILLMQSRVITIFSTITKLRNHNIYMKNYTDYMEIANHKYEGTHPVEQRKDDNYELEFRNVTFHYPNSANVILKNVSFRLKVGSKLAIVGPNGAGKTTFIKLLCRLYDPTEGEILLNGVNIKQYRYEYYQNLFSVVFQDFQIFAFPVAENVAASSEYDEDRVWLSLKQAGIDDRVKQMKKGIQTKLMKDQQEEGEEGIEISGGEKQKIALARALYREAPIVILDEPTSALDPIAEQDIYERFNEMVKDKTAVFISHRMSSCRFCDQVIVFDEGSIVQNGTHEELVADENGLYAKMWGAQAQYYTKNVTE